MANEEHLAILKQGVEAWNKWRYKNRGIPPDLSGADLYGVDLRHTHLEKIDLLCAHLSYADLRGAHLSGAHLRAADLRAADLQDAKLDTADLSEANLSSARLRTAYLVGADLSGARLNWADLGRANFTKADLFRANLSDANLSEANLIRTKLGRAKLDGADMAGAVMGSTVFGDTDLSLVKGLDKVDHRGPSTVGIDTIYKSRGKIPEVFLRGCGVPDQMVAFIASLAGQPETNRVWLRMMIDEYFNKSELQTLCFDMGIDFDSLNGENKSDKARELVAYCERRRTIPDLVIKCRELRPKVSWEGEYE